jgi:hypothetical protein
MKQSDGTGPYVQTANGTFALAGNSGADVNPQLPPAIGPQTAANSLSVVNAISSAPTSASGTITSGGTAQNAAAANASRRGFQLQNNSTGDLWFSTIATAVQSQPSFKLPPGAYYESPPFGGGVGAISIVGATTGQAFTGREY